MTQVLLIDDEEDFTELIGTLLSFHNISVDIFNDPSKVEDAIQKNQYSLFVTDLMMPNIDGFTLIDQIRAHPNYQKTPIITLSAKVLNDEERKRLFQHEVHFMSKPFEPQELVDLITQLIAEKT